MSRQTKRVEPDRLGDGPGAVRNAALDVDERTGGNGAGAVSTTRHRRRSGEGGSGPNPARFAREVRNELRQVAWPTRSELANYTTVVITVLVIMIALIFALNFGFGKLVLYLFQR